MTQAVRIRLIVAVAVLVAAGIVVAVVSATRQDPSQPRALCKLPQAVVVPGVRSPNIAAVRAAFHGTPKQAARALEPLAQTAPSDPVVQLNYGTALACGGYFSEATSALRAAKKAGRNTFYEIRADNLLHLQYFSQGYPIVVLTGSYPLLVQGQLQQRQGHQHSAERLYARAARLHPGSDEAQVAAAVGRFDMDDLSASFSRLGPLVRRFPRSQSVRFHLGLLLAWTGQRDQAITEFRLARKLGAKTALGKGADTFLRRLVPDGTNKP